MNRLVLSQLWTLGAAAICIIYSPGANGEALRTDLHALIRKSDAILHIKRKAYSNEKNRVVEFDVLRTVKGNAGPGVVLCNNSMRTERYDLSGPNAKEIIAFLRAGEDCLDPLPGLSSTIRVINGIAYTAAVSGEPEKQTVIEFVTRIQRILAAVPTASP